MLLSFWDILLPPFYLLFVLCVFIIYRRGKHEICYKYFLPGLIVKIFGGIFLSLTYQLYYLGGDTTAYFITADAIGNLIFKDFRYFLEVMFSSPSEELFHLFDNSTGYPIYWFHGKDSVFTSKYYVLIELLSFNSFISASILAATISFTGVWKLYRVFYNEFPHLSKNLAIAILFIPSVVFWGSGILKDSITIAALGWYTYGFYFGFIKGKNFKLNLIFIGISSFLFLSIKPYIFFALLPGSILWLSKHQSVKIDNVLIKKFLTPTLLVLGIILGFLTLNLLGDYLGQYKLDNVLEKAVITQQDMKQDYYGGNSFDIGDFEPTVLGMAFKAPQALFAAFYRPSFLDARNPVMIFSAIENFLLLLLTLYLLIKLGILNFIKNIQRNPLLLFSILFSLFFAFSVGISVSNFGSLVRLRIPAIPFFLASLFILHSYIGKKNKENL
jgi:hypothetical protein